MPFWLRTTNFMRQIRAGYCKETEKKVQPQVLVLIAPDHIARAGVFGIVIAAVSFLATHAYLDWKNQPIKKTEVASPVSGLEVVP